MATDPVCGMFVEERPESLQLTRDNRTYYFCSSSCRDSYAQPEAERRRLLRRLGAAWPLSVAILIFTYLDPSRDAGVLSAAFAAVVQGYAGGPFYVGAWDALRRRIGNMDLLIAVGSSAAFGYSVAALALPGRLPPVYYFDASALIVTLILTGNYLEHLARLRAGSALARLGELLPTEVIVLRNGAESTVPVGELVPGDTVRVRAGSRMPADGTIRAGRTSVDEAILTGEPGWIPKSPGDPVLAGSVNREGEVSVEVRRVGPETFVAQIGTLLSDAEMARVPLQRTADRIAAWFVPGVLALAIGAGIFWHVVEGTNLTISLLVFVTVTITACPCAFGIATPAALLVGTGRAAEDGILFRGEDAIERVARVDTILTDKTGTLTLPDPALSTWRAIPPFTEGELLATAWGLSRATPHPLSEALRAGAARLGVERRTIDGAHLDPGRGVRGRIGAEEVAILRGDAAREAGLDLTSLSEWLRSVDERGDSWSVVVCGGRLLGAVAFGSVLVPGARDAVAELRSAGIRVVLVTGDQERPAQRIGSLVGADRVHARADPAAKVALVGQYRREGARVGFVGDGVNDAPALAAADAGFAIGSGTDVAREAGQVILVRGGFASVPAAISWARRTVGRVRGNLTWALAYNAVLLPIAAGALVPALGLGVYQWLPIAGALAMGLSSSTVVLNSLSLRRPLPSLGALPGAATPRIPTPS